MKRAGKRHGRSEQDNILVLVGVTAVFGILNFNKFAGEELSASLASAVLAVIFAMFWIFMAFDGGREKSRSFIICSAVIWGASLLFILWNIVFPTMFTDYTGAFIQVASYFMFVLMLFFVATVTPLVFGIASLDLPLHTPLHFLYVCLCAILVVSATYFLGYRYARNRRLKLDEERKAVLKKN